MLYQLSYTHQVALRPVVLNSIAGPLRGLETGYPLSTVSATARASSVVGPGWATNAVPR